MASQRCNLLLGTGQLLLLVLLSATFPGSSEAHFFGGGQNQVVQLGTYDPMLQECYFSKILIGQNSPKSLTFNNQPAAKAIAFISVESDPGIDFTGVGASVTSGALGTGTSITLQVTSSPRTLVFVNNLTIRMFCKK